MPYSKTLTRAKPLSTRHLKKCVSTSGGGATGDRHHPFIRLRHTGRAPPSRFQRDAHRQGYAAGVCSTCHAGLLAPGARGVHGPAHSEAVPPETHHHSRGAVGFVAYWSRTLSAS